MYINVVKRVREAFESVEVVRLDCTHVGSSGCKKIAVKLRVFLCPLLSQVCFILMHVAAFPLLQISESLYFAIFAL